MSLEISTNITVEMESDYVCMEKKLQRKRSTKTVVRKISVKVKRQKSIVKRSKSKNDKQKPKLVRRPNVKRTKSFIVKRRSFKRPRRWSTYIREDQISKQCLSGTLPRIKGIWQAKKYKNIVNFSNVSHIEERRHNITRYSSVTV